LYRKHSR